MEGEAGALDDGDRDLAGELVERPHHGREVLRAVVPDDDPACGIPVVASDLPAIREVMGDGGELVDPRSPSALAEAMARVLTEPDRACELVRRSRERLTAHGPSRYVRSHVDLYRSVAQLSPARS